MKLWLQNIDIERYSKHNEGKSIVVQKFIRTLKNKIYKYMTSIDKLADVVNKYNNKCHSTIKIKPVDVKSSTYIDFGIEINEKHHKVKVGDHVRISKYKSIFAEGYTPNSSD